MTFDEVLLDADGDHSTTDDQLTLNGNVRFAASFDTAIRVENFTLQRFLFAVNLEESVNLDMTGDFNQADIDQQTEVADVDLATLNIPVGPVPVVLDIDLVVTMGINGTVTAEIQASAQQSTDVRIGGEYTDADGWGGINEKSSSFEVPPPEFGLSDASARGYVRPELQIKLYGIAGPFVYAEPYVRFVAELYTSPYWELYGGLEFGAGFVVTVPVLGEVTRWEASFDAFEEPIEESSNRAPSVEVVSPDDGATVTAGSDLTLTVTATDREQSDVTVRITGDNIDREVIVTEGAEEQIALLDLCEGVRNLQVTAVDDEGATASVDFSAVVENATPVVTLDRSTLTGNNAPPIFPGGYLSAAAQVDDSRCSEADAVDYDFVEWYVDGSRVARSTDLLTRLSPTDYSAGDVVSVQARFDDGGKVGQSDTVNVTLDPTPSGDLPVTVNITSCSICGGTVNVGGDSYIPNEVSVTGVAFDPKDGELSGGELVWEIRNEGDSTREMIGNGESVTFNISDIYPTPDQADGDNTIYLTVDDGGQTVSDSETFFVAVGG